MSYEDVNTGSSPNDGLGDGPRTAFTKINNNFAALALDALADLETAGGQQPGPPVIVRGRNAPGDGGGGTFFFVDSDLATEVASDPAGAVYRAPSSDPTGASGAWVRHIETTINARWFGFLPAAADTENATALQRFASYLENQNGFAQFVDDTQTSYRPAEGYIPAGSYFVASRTTITGAVSGRQVENSRVTIKGAGSLATEILLTTDADAIFEITGAVRLEGMTLRGDFNGGTFNGTGVQLGDNANELVARQCLFRDLDFYDLSVCFRVEICWDTVFDQVRIFSLPSGGKGYYFPLHNYDNSNHLTWIRGHWESVVGGTFIDASEGVATAGDAHHHWTFITPHWETRSFDTRTMNVKHVRRCVIVNCVMVQNNTRGDDFGLDETDTVTAFELEDCWNWVFTGGAMQVVSNVASLPAKFITATGATTGILFDGTYFSPGILGAGLDLTTLYDTTNLDGVPDRCLRFRDVQIKNNTAVLLSSPPMIGVDTRQWKLETGYDAQQLLFRYSTGTTSDVDFGDPVFGLDSIGSLQTGNWKEILNGDSAVFGTPTDGSTLGTAVHLVIADAPQEMAALVLARGTTMYAMTAGRFVEVDTDTPAAGNYGIKKGSPGSIEITNNIGSDRNFAVFTFAFLGLP